MLQVIYARRKLVHLYSSTSQRGRFLFHAANRNFIPASALSNVTGVIVDCPSGMKHEDGMCGELKFSIFGSPMNVY